LTARKFLNYTFAVLPVDSARVSGPRTEDGTIHCQKGFLNYTFNVLHDDADGFFPAELETRCLSGVLFAAMATDLSRGFAVLVMNIANIVPATSATPRPQPLMIVASLLVVRVPAVLAIAGARSDCCESFSCSTALEFFGSSDWRFGKSR
jgi:hypothetical protein